MDFAIRISVFRWFVFFIFAEKGQYVYADNKISEEKKKKNIKIIHNKITFHWDSWVLETFE